MINKIVVPTGYMGSGSSAVTDLISEFEGYEKNNGSFEYVFLHCPDGIFDLEDKLLYGNNALRSDEALYRFISCMRDLYEKRFYWVSGYKNKISKDFLQYVEEFIEDIGTIKMNDVYWYFQENPNTFKLERKNFIKRAIGKITQNKIVLKQPLQYENMHWAFPNEEEFYSAAKRFLSKIWNALGIEEHNLVLDQLLLPHNLFRLENYFDESVRIIVVERDPRDVFLLNKYFWSKNGGVVPYAVDVNLFCEMYLRMRKNEKCVMDKRILRLHFEDLIYNYEESIEKLYCFLDVQKEQHEKRSKTIFKPEVSINNTQIFLMDNAYKEEVSVIERRLSDYLYSFPNQRNINHNIKDVF